MFCLSQRPHYTGEICKRNFISTDLPTFRTNPSRKRSFSRTLFKPEEFETAGRLFICFHMDGKHFENKAFRKRLRCDKQACDFPGRVFLKHKSKITGDCCVFKFLRRSVDRKHLMRFQSETSVFKFLRRSVDWA